MASHDAVKSSEKIKGKKSRQWLYMVKKDWKKHWKVYILVIPLILYYIIWSYAPMYGIQVAFKDFSPRKGIWRSDFIGFKNIISFFSSAYAYRVIRNTIVINFWNLVFGFPLPILFALALNEVRNVVFKRTVQTITYMPYFISLVVICGILVDFCSSDGLFGELAKLIGIKPVNLLGDAKYFRTVYVSSEVWQKLGWDSIIFLSALASINTELYEAATIDGAGRIKQTLYVTLPGIMPTIAILLVLRIGSMMSIGFEKIILL